MLRWSPLDWCWAGGRGAVRSRVHRLLLSPVSVGEVQLGARDSSGVGGGRRRRRAWCPDEGSFVQGQPVAPAATATCASSTAPPRFRTRSAAALPLGSSGQAGGKAARAEPTTAHAVSGTRAGRSPPRSFRGFPCRLVPTAPPLQGQGPRRGPPPCLLGVLSGSRGSVRRWSQTLCVRMRVLLVEEFCQVLLCIC